MKILGLIALFFMVAATITFTNAEEEGVDAANIPAVTYNPACYQACDSKATFVAWCRTQGPSNPCHALDNYPGPWNIVNCQNGYCITGP